MKYFFSLCHEHEAILLVSYRRSDYCTTIKDIRCSLAAEDNEDNVFPIQIRLYVIRHSKSVVAKICHMVSPLPHPSPLPKKNRRKLLRSTLHCADSYLSSLCLPQKYPYAACAIKWKDLMCCCLVWISFFPTKEKGGKPGKRKKGEKVRSERRLQHCEWATIFHTH